MIIKRDDAQMVFVKCPSCDEDMNWVGADYIVCYNTENCDYATDYDEAIEFCFG